MGWALSDDAEPWLLLLYCNMQLRGGERREGGGRGKGEGGREDRKGGREGRRDRGEGGKEGEGGKDGRKEEGGREEEEERGREGDGVSSPLRMPCSMSSREYTSPPMLYAVTCQNRLMSSTELGSWSVVARPWIVRAL